MELKFLENPDLKNTTEDFFGSINKESQVIYIIILTFLFVAGGLMAIIHVPVYLETRGTLRPYSEKKQICSPVQGIIEKIYIEENQKVKKDELILRIDAEKEKGQVNFLNQEIKKTSEWLRDCLYLVNNLQVSIDSLRTSKYQNEYLLNQQEQQIIEFEIKQLQKDIGRLKPMEKDSLISKKEMEEIELKCLSLVGKQKSNVSYKKNQWQDQIDNYKQKLSSLLREKYTLEHFIRKTEIRSPAAGTIQEIRNIYSGDFCNQGEQVCMLIPDTGIMVEMFIPSRDIGFISPGMKTRFKIEAFDYKYWGFLEGKCVSISKDYEIVGNNPFFRVICRLEEPFQLKYGNKTVIVTPGMTVSAQFIFTSRNIWQLFRDEIYDWIGENNKYSSSL